MEKVALPEAATIVLVRQGATGLQVYLVRRNPRTAFMGGNYVFPGGVLDPADRDAERWIALSDLGPTPLEERVGGDLGWRDALSYGVAAIRETFEEAGILLARRVAEEDLRALLKRREEGTLADGWLLDEATSRGWRLGLSWLSRWARWITPAGMKRRYDTRFFLASPPPAQTCSPDGREVVDGVWLTPEDALARNVSGEVPLSPPTVVTLQELLASQDARALLAECRPWGAPLLPRFFPLSGGGVILEPWDPDWAAVDPSFEPESLRKALLRAGEPFSRLWSDGEVWRPVRAS